MRQAQDTDDLILTVENVNIASTKRINLFNDLN
jgi:hypothetical protein